MSQVVKLMMLTFPLVALVGCAGLTSGRQAPPPPTTAPAQVSGAERGTIPVGQELDVRLQSTLSSETAQVEQRFQTTTVVDLMEGDRKLVPAGSIVRGVVRDVDRPGRLDRTGSLTLAFDQLVVNGRAYPMRGLATEIYKSEGLRDEAATVGTAGAVGAIVGGIIGGLRGRSSAPRSAPAGSSPPPKARTSRFPRGRSSAFAWTRRSRSGDRRAAFCR